MANEQSNALTRKLYTEYKLDRSDVFSSKQGFQIVTRTGIEKIQYKENITVSFEVITAQRDYVLIKATATKDGRSIETIGSATKGSFEMVPKKKKNGETYKSLTLINGSTDSWYVAEIAEKRALSRAILKVTGLYEYGCFGEDENQEDFKPQTEKNKASAEDLVDDIISGRK